MSRLRGVRTPKGERAPRAASRGVIGGGPPRMQHGATRGLHACSTDAARPDQPGGRSSLKNTARVQMLGQINKP
jgi:hypothetical protein